MDKWILKCVIGLCCISGALLMCNVFGINNLSCIFPVKLLTSGVDIGIL
jgi:hypothetical protein